MKRVLVATAAALALALVTGSGASAAGATVSNVDITFGFESCNGDTVVFAATLHSVDRLGVSTDEALHLVSHTQIHGTGVGAPSGDTYLINENLASTTANFRQSEDGTISFDITSVDGVVAVSQGSSDNTRIFLLTHVTVNANGDRTATVDNVRVDCTG